MPTARITNTLHDATGAPMIGAPVDVQLLVGGAELGDAITTETDARGTWTLDLERTDTPDPVHTTYRVTERPAGQTHTHHFLVPGFDNALLPFLTMPDARAPIAPTVTLNALEHGIKGDGSDETLTVNAWLAGLPRSAAAYFPHTASGYSFSGPLLIRHSLILFGDGDTSFYWTNDNCVGIQITASNVEVYGIAMSSPTWTAPETHGGSWAMQIGGPTPALSLTNIQIHDCTFDSWGMYALNVQYVNHFWIEGNSITHTGYAAVMVQSGRDGWISSNTIDHVQGLSPPAETDAYGIALTTTQQNGYADPPSCFVWVIGNTIDHIPSWEGLDTHGGHDLIFAFNTVTNCSIGCQIGIRPHVNGIGLSGYAPGRIDYIPYNVGVICNTFDSGRTDGGAQVGIYLTGGQWSSTAPADQPAGQLPSPYAINLSAIGNTVIGYGDQSSAISAAIKCFSTWGAVVELNTIFSPSPYGIIWYTSNFNFRCRFNTVIDPWSDSLSVGEADGITTRSEFITGLIDQNTITKTADGVAARTPPPAYIATRGVGVFGIAGTCQVQVGTNPSTADQPFYDGTGVSMPPYSPPTSTAPVFNVLHDAAAAPLPGVRVIVELAVGADYTAFNPFGAEIISTPIEAHTDADGTWTLTLERNDLLPGTAYKLSEYIDPFNPRVQYFAVGAAGGPVNSLLTVAPT